MAYSSDLCTGGTVTASSEQSGNEAAKGFDDNTGTRWQSNAPATQWIKYQFTAAKAVSKVRINPFVYLGDASIKDFAVYGSNDDSAWDSLHTDTFPNESDWHDFTFSNGTAYSYIRIEITTSWSANPSLLEIEMMQVVLQKSVFGRHDVYGPIGKSAKPFYAVTAPCAKQASSRYAATAESQKAISLRYHITKSSSRTLASRYHCRPPVVEIFNDGDSSEIDLLSLGLLEPGEQSAEFIIHLWNAKNESDPALKVDSPFITLSLADGSYSGGEEPDGAEMVSEKWFEIKSNGVVGSGITDDAQGGFTPVGGDPQTGGLALGAIPSGTARVLHCRVNLPATPATVYSCRPRLLVSYNAVI